MKLLLENWRGYLKESQEIWYHGGKIEGSLGPLYLSGDEALSSMHGDLYSFTISPNARWLNLSKIQMGPLALISMDSVGFSPDKINKIKDSDYDVVWDSKDFNKGYEQIFVVNPEVLIPVKGDV